MNDNRLIHVDQDLMALDAMLEFRRMRQVVGRLLFGKRQTALLTLDSYRGNRGIINQHKTGIHAIPVQRIKGSVNGHADYDADFYPQYGTRERWTRHYLAYLNGDAPSVIQVVKVDDIYFVENGHIDVSVAKVLGYSYVDAHVIEIELEAIPAETTKQIPEYRAAGSLEVESGKLVET